MELVDMYDRCLLTDFSLPEVTTRSDMKLSLRVSRLPRPFSQVANNTTNNIVTVLSFSKLRCYKKDRKSVV